MTVFEAITIVKEILRDFECSPSAFSIFSISCIIYETCREYRQSLKIITGKGSHSAHKVAVLKPAIKNALLDDGWIIGTWDAGLVVRGRSS